MTRLEKIDGEEFVIEAGTECTLKVSNGPDTGFVTWHEATQRYRGKFNGWGSDADSIEKAIKIAARRIISTRKGITREKACKAMEEYIKG